MSALQQLAHRHAFFNRDGIAPLAAELAVAFAAAAEAFREPGMLPAGTLTGIEGDLLYVLLRHRIWASAPLFCAVVTDHLATSFQLPRAVAQSLSSSLLAALRQCAPAPPVCFAVNDQEFLRYVCVHTATAQDEQSLLLDLGLGGRLLRRLQSALAPDQGDDEEQPQVARHFLPALDASIAAVVSQIGLDLARLPWLLQQERLRYHLATVAAPWSGVLQQRGPAWLFDLLLHLASRKASSTRQIGAELRLQFPDEPAFALDSSITALCQELAKHHLLSLERGISSWRALPLAEELTAAAFAAQATAGMQEGQPLPNLSQLCPAYQASMLRTMPLRAEQLEALLHTERPLAPAALKAGLQRFSGMVTTVRLEASLRTLLTQEASAWLRKAASDVARGLGVALDHASVARSRPWRTDLIPTKTVSTTLD